MDKIRGSLNEVGSKMKVNVQLLVDHFTMFFTSISMAFSIVVILCFVMLFNIFSTKPPLLLNVGAVLLMGGLLFYLWKAKREKMMTNYSQIFP